MKIVNRYVPTIIDGGNEKPIPLEGVGWPYNLLPNDRRFEELLYSLYRSEIDHKGFEKFNGILLMSGVRDQGTDCCLTIDGKTHGVIQCKKYDKNYNKEEFGEEITKYALYSLIDETLIGDASNFRYYIAVSKNFTAPCTKFIKDFNNNILTEPNLDKWIANNLKHPTLQSLGLNDNRSAILKIFQSIKVQPIYPEDLNLLLVKSYNTDIAQLFFAVRTVTDNAYISSELRKFHLNELSKEQIKQELKTGSAGVSSQSNTMGDIPDSHIVRSETEALFNWASTSNEVAGVNQNICLLVGGAGYGKTVILKDLYDKFGTEDIPALALKADKLYVNNFKELQEKINFSIPVKDLVEQCKREFDSLVIVIDQIDALSQSLSSKRDYLDTYVSLIESYKNDSIVRFIISVRPFDLLYDPGLRPYRNMKRIEVNLLDQAIVLEQLKKIGLTKETITPKLLELLKTPSHLDVFSRIAGVNRNFAGVDTIQGLYAELWKAKVINIREPHQLDRRRVQLCLHRIASEMYSNQQIAIPEVKFTEFEVELQYLKSEQLIVAEAHNLQFFHQSFYDYVFAKQFVESGSSILDYLERESQSIMARAALKMILNYLREQASESYIKQANSLLKNKNIHFHINHLTLSVIAASDYPTQNEIALFKSTIKTTALYLITFGENCSGGWIDFLIRSGELNAMLFPEKAPLLQRTLQRIRSFLSRKEVVPQQSNPGKDIALQMLCRYIPDNPESVIPYLKKITDKQIVLKVLYYLDNWQHPEAIPLLESCDDLDSNDFTYFKILDDIADSNSAYVLAKIKDSFNESDSHHSNEQYRKERLVKKLIASLPGPTFNFLYTSIINSINNQLSHVEQKPLIRDFIIFDSSFEEDHLNGTSFVFQQFLGTLKEWANENNELYQQFLNENIRSPYLAVQRAIFHSYTGNEKNLRDRIMESFDYLKNIDALNSYDVLSDAIRITLRNVYPHLTKAQANEILTTIVAIPLKGYFLYQTDDGKRRKRMFFGQNRYRYLLALPYSVISSIPGLKFEFEQYKRRFPDTTLIQTGGSRGGVVRAPLTKTAYEKMTTTSWLSSFRKINEERGMDRWGDDFLKGGLSEHAAVFRAAVKSNPAKHLPVIEALFKDFTLPLSYHFSGLDGLVDAEFDPLVVLKFLKLLLKLESADVEARSMVMIAGHLIHKQVYDKEVIDFLLVQALSNPDPERGKDKDRDGERLVSAGINSVRGGAVYRLSLIQDKAYADKILDALEVSASTDELSVVAAILYRFAYLMNIDRERSFDLFISILNRKDHLFTLEAAWSLSYLVHQGFDRLIPYFKRVVQKPLEDKDVQNVSTILFSAYYNDYEGSKELFYDLLNKFPAAGSNAVRNSFEFINMNENSFEKSIGLFDKFINSGDESILQAFDSGFMNMENIDFRKIYPFLKQYAQTKAIYGGDHFLSFLLPHAYSHPDECLQLFEIVLQQRNKEEKKDTYRLDFEEQSVNLIIAIYNALRPDENNMHKAYGERLLTLFDITLRDARYRSNAERVLEKIIY